MEDLSTINFEEINQAVKAEVAKVRIAQKVFPTTMYSDEEDPQMVYDEVIDLANFSIQEGITKQYVEVYHKFHLTSSQVANDMKDKKCKTLAVLAAKALALAEDAIFYSGENARTLNLLPANIDVDNLASAKQGLLGEIGDGPNNDEPDKTIEPIDIKQVGRIGVVYGENTFAAVADGRAILESKAQAPDYALFLPTKIYADSFVPPSEKTLITTADRIKPLVEGGFYGTGRLPKNKGLMVALGGEPNRLHCGREARVEFIRKEGTNYFFRVVERIQYVTRDPRSIVVLNFTDEVETRESSGGTGSTGRGSRSGGNV